MLLLMVVVVFIAFVLAFVCKKSKVAISAPEPAPAPKPVSAVVSAPEPAPAPEPVPAPKPTPAPEPAPAPKPVKKMVFIDDSCENIEAAKVAVKGRPESWAFYESASKFLDDFRSGVIKPDFVLTDLFWSNQEVAMTERYDEYIANAGSILLGIQEDCGNPINRIAARGGEYRTAWAEFSSNNFFKENYAYGALIFQEVKEAGVKVSFVTDIWRHSNSRSPVGVMGVLSPLMEKGLIDPEWLGDDGSLICCHKNSQDDWKFILGHNF